MTPPPLPATAAVDGAVLVTGDRAKLPPDVAALIDPSLPLPPGVQFFEKQITFGDVVSAAVWSVGLGGFGVLCVIFGIAVLVHPTGPVTVSSQADWLPLGFGLICVLGAWMMAGTAFARLGIRAAQSAGRATRVGILLTPAALIESGETAWCVLPRAQVRAVKDEKTVSYELKGQEKLVRLPDRLVDGDRPALSAAIRRWMAAG